MYIIAIGWLYVTLMMALTEASIVAGVFSFLFYGLLPTALILYLGGAKVRRQRRAWQEQQAARQAAQSAVAGDQLPGQPDGKDAEADQ
ncbi:MAG TPA: hypothetical protein VFK74_07720 [Azospira sp.]|nr:hypothetical protein [Azospira sp.]